MWKKITVLLRSGLFHSFVVDVVLLVLEAGLKKNVSLFIVRTAKSFMSRRQS